MDLFAPLFGILLVALLLVDHSILNAKIEKTWEGAEAL